MKSCAKALNLVVIPLFLTCFLQAETKPVPAAPVPEQILSAKRAFVGNAGGDERAWEEPQFSGGPNRTYDEFYADMKTWGRFELVSAPADADLILEIRLSSFEYEEKGLGNPHYDPQLRLLIRDPKTNAVLWGLTEHVEGALMKGNHDKNFSQALSRLVAEVQRVATPSGATPGAAKKQ